MEEPESISAQALVTFMFTAIFGRITGFEKLPSEYLGISGVFHCSDTGEEWPPSSFAVAVVVGELRKGEENFGEKDFSSLAT